MTTMELEARKAMLVRDILTEVDSLDLLKKLQKAYDKLKSQSEEITISKEEVLKGINTGLKEMQERKRSGKKAKTLEDLINEL